MCCTLLEAALAKTIIGIFVGALRHTMVYQAVISPKDETKWNGFFGVFPKQPGTPTIAIDCADTPDILSNLALIALNEGTKGSRGSYSLGMVEITDTENFAFVVAENLADIVPALNEYYDTHGIDSEERVYPSEDSARVCAESGTVEYSFWFVLVKPQQPEELSADRPEELVPGLRSNKKPGKKMPFAISYEPIDPSKAFYPGEDSHTREAPKPGMVNVDHTLILGVQGQKPNKRVWAAVTNGAEICEAVPQLSETYPTWVTAIQERGQRMNGHWEIDLNELKFERVPMVA